MVMAHPVPVVCADWHVGTGYSPPARNEAVSPESAMSSGSANWRINPLVSKALKTRSRLLPLPARLASATPKGAAPESNVPAVLNSGTPAGPEQPILNRVQLMEFVFPTEFPAASTAGVEVTVPRPAGCPFGVKPPTPVLKPRFPALLAPNQFTPS